MRDSAAELDAASGTFFVGTGLKRQAASLWRHATVAEILVERFADGFDFRRRKQGLHLLEEFALFHSNVGGEKGDECRQARVPQPMPGGGHRLRAKYVVLSAEVGDKFGKFGARLRCGKEMTLFGFEVKTDLVAKQARDFFFPMRDDLGRSPVSDQGALNEYTERQRVLMLVG